MRTKRVSRWTQGLAWRSLMVVALVTSVAMGETKVLYVAPNGNDQWSGKLSTPNRAKTDGPFASLERARDEIRRLKQKGLPAGGVTVAIRGGVYYLDYPFVLQAQDSGTSDAPITYAAYRGEKVVISGGRRIGGWQRCQNGMWMAKIPAAGKWKFRQLFVNDRRAVLARSPNEGYHRIVGGARPFVDAATGQERDSSKQAFRFKAGDLRNWPDVHEANVTVFYHWETGMLRIQSVDEATNTVTFTGPMKWSFWKGQRYYVENTRAALDAPGEWFLDLKEGRVYYIPRPGEDMRRAVVIAPLLTNLVQMAGDVERGEWVEHIRFERLSFEHCDYVLEPEGHCDWHAARTVPAALNAVAARHCSIQRCTVSHVGGYAVAFGAGCKNNRIQQNHLYDLGAGGIKIGHTHIPAAEAAESGSNQVSDNLIHDGGIVYYGAVGIWIGQSSDNLITHNEICDLNYTAISCGWTWGYGRSKAHRNRIEYNYLHDIGRGKLCDMGAIYTLGTSPGTVIRGNLIHDIWDWEEGYGAGGIYLDEGSSQILVENNVVYRTASGGLTVHYGKNNIVRNNIFAFGRDAQIHLGRRDKESSLKLVSNIIYFDEGVLMKRDSDLEADNNIYWNTKGEPIIFPNNLTFQQWQEKGYDTHSLIADPKFVAPQRYDFRLRPDSPAFKLGFHPIDITQAGLRDAELLRLAKRLRRPLSEIPRRAEVHPLTLDDTFEDIPLGVTADNAYTYGETSAAKIRVSDETAATGKQSLKFTDAPGLEYSWKPYIFYCPHWREGVVENSFDLRLERGAKVCIEWRDASTPYRSGPIITITEGQLNARGRYLLTIPFSEWVHFHIECGLGTRATGTWKLTVTVPGQSPQKFENLPCDPAYRQLEWLGFVSDATDTAVFYLDNIKLRAKQVR